MKILFSVFFSISLIANETVFLKDYDDAIRLTNDLSAINSEIPIQAVYKHPWIAVGLSSLFPGMGQVYLGDSQTAGVLAGSAGLSIGAVFASRSRESYLEPSIVSFLTTYFYGVYSAYRDARNFNGITAYSYKMPTEQFTELAYAPFQYSVLKKPEVWGGILGSLALASLITYFAYPQNEDIKIAASIGSRVKPGLSLPIALGEEAYFRGFLLPALSEMSNSSIGLVASSLAFGAIHIPNAWDKEDSKERHRYYAFSLPLITVLGAYCGWMTQKNHSLKESVALHMWYDFVIFSVKALSPQKASLGPTQFALSIPF